MYTSIRLLFRLFALVYLVLRRPQDCRLSRCFVKADARIPVLLYATPLSLFEGAVNGSENFVFVSLC